jgi:hypothetical protein
VAKKQEEIQKQQSHLENQAKSAQVINSYNHGAQANISAGLSASQSESGSQSAESEGQNSKFANFGGANFSDIKNIDQSKFHRILQELETHASKSLKELYSEGRKLNFFKKIGNGIKEAGEKIKDAADDVKRKFEELKLKFTKLTRKERKKTLEQSIQEIDEYIRELNGKEKKAFLGIGKKKLNTLKELRNNLLSRNLDYKPS